MALASIFAVAFPLLSLLHCAAARQNSSSWPICSDFQCKDLGSFGFPFYDGTDPRCGLCRLDCNEQVPRIQFREEDRWYNLTRRDRNDTITIIDDVFRHHVQRNSCDALNNFTFLISPPITYSISIFPPFNLFKCNNSPEATSKTDKHFNLSLYNCYRHCKDHNLYYRYPVHYLDNSDLLTIPNECSVIQLPQTPQAMLPSGTNSADLFRILDVNIPLNLVISEDCLHCHYNGGQCRNLNQSQEFYCVRPAKGKKSNKLIIASVAITIGILVFVITIFFRFIRKFTLGGTFMLLWWKKTKKDQNIENFLNNYGSLAPKRYSYSDVKKMTNSFKAKLGQGGYGHVYKGRLCNGNLVAVKILNGSKGNGEDFINEVASISRTSHVNIVNLLGFCIEGHKRALVYEFMPNGSLEKFIYDGSSLKGRQLGWEKLYQVAVGIARGLEYLHCRCNTRILHFDIKPHNILLDEDFCPKVADFGLAKLFPGKESIISMDTARGTFGYIAPEVFCRNFGGVSHKSDVYSYGMMVLEMVGGRKNIDVGVVYTSEIFFPHWIYKQLESNNELGLHGIVNEEENEIARKMVIVSLWCIQTDPVTRPSMTTVLEMLEGSLESLQIPPKPYLSSPSRSRTGSQTIDII